jgi:phenylacetate-coenzyme A ligase PaaK-like adenylate-forming protein
VIASSSLNALLEAGPYGLSQGEKRALLEERCRELTRHHYRHCEPYRMILDRLFGGEAALDFERLEDMPFLPVSLFKTRELRSVSPDSVVKTLTSSGTTGQAVSRIFLDADTARLQSRTLVTLMQHFLGKERRPLVFLDHSGVIRDRRSSSARGAGILGMLPFGRKPFYALSEDMSLDLAGLRRYLEENREQSPVFFGFTFMVWRYFIEALEGLGESLAVPEAVLLHSGGWKKLVEASVSPEEFRRRVLAATGIERVINYYGMVEQVGSVFFENALHALHASVYSDVIVRDTNTLEPLPPGEKGLIQVVSALPTSYPGHSLLTEDLGVVLGCDNPEAGMAGQYFRSLGRLPRAELRGCSDTFQRPQNSENGEYDRERAEAAND